MKAQLLVIDPPYTFSDKLSMSDVKRSPEAQYKSVLDNEAILNLNIKSIAADDSILALWVPSTLLEFGLELMKTYGFEFKQTWIWVKSKKEPLAKLKKQAKKALKNGEDISELIDNFDINDCLSFYMGRVFRQTHEVCLIGVRGKVHKDLKNKSQISVFIGNNSKHSAKPEALQDRLEKMYPSYTNRVELFARRDRVGWKCYGDQNSSSLNEDIRDSIMKIRFDDNANLNSLGHTWVDHELFLNDMSPRLDTFSTYIDITCKKCGIRIFHVKDGDDECFEIHDSDNNVIKDQKTSQCYNVHTGPVNHHPIIPAYDKILTCDEMIVKGIIE